MATFSVGESVLEFVGRERCYGCWRPVGACFCDVIPSVENRTEVLILQHMRERFHAFNTARIVRKALVNSQLLVDHTDRLAAARLPLAARAGLLYPGADARVLSEVPPEEQPEQLVVLDGTWHHAKTLLRDIPALDGLPRFRLAPSEPGRYRIRREPTSTSLSTVEAVVAALRELEPETTGLDELLAAFDTMVDRQLARSKVVPGGRRNKRRNRTPGNVPRALVGDLENVVVAYGESTPGRRGEKHAARGPVYWVAERPATGERFAAVLRPELALTETFLEHLELSLGDFAEALSPEAFRSGWQAFLRWGDTVVVYNQGTARLLESIGADFARCLVLKSVRCFAEQRYRALDELIAGEEITVASACHPGRAGRRLANAVAVVRHLNALAKAGLSVA